MSYAQQLEKFRSAFEQQNNERRNRLYPNLDAESVEVETGYKFDKVYIRTSCGGDTGETQRMGRYMVESRTGDIWGIKSWTQVNKRRWYGTLDTVDQYDWSDFYARPLPGTDAEKDQYERESKFKAGHKKRGRRPKAESLSTSE